ncbi:MAG TPA: NUDIX domain-containing protein [Eubacteriales bacterium]|nr:NUDIX domain-containing protein [Eubacteriales bacterium]
MRIIKIIDKANYDKNLPHSVRRAARAIIRIDGKYALVKSEKEGYYKFPGGGVEKGETIIDALIREVREEIGFVIDAETIAEYGETVEYRLSDIEKYTDTIFEHRSYYFTCNISGKTTQNLDNDEAELKFVYELADIDTAIKQNEPIMEKYYSTNIIRETAVLYDVKKNLK